MTGEITIQTPTQTASLEIESGFRNQTLVFEKMQELKDMVRMNSQLLRDEPFVVFLSFPSKMNFQRVLNDPY